MAAVNNQIKRFGSFLTNTNESTKDHANLTNPDGTALADLRALIYEQLHISSKLLDGSYTEEEYRAFYASQLRPLMGAFEELMQNYLTIIHILLVHVSSSYLTWFNLPH